MTLSRRTAAALSALVLSTGLAACGGEEPLETESDISEPGGAAPGGEEKNSPDGGEVEPPDGE